MPSICLASLTSKVLVCCFDLSMGTVDVNSSVVAFVVVVVVVVVVVGDWGGGESSVELPQSRTGSSSC